LRVERAKFRGSLDSWSFAPAYFTRFFFPFLQLLLAVRACVGYVGARAGGRAGGRVEASLEGKERLHSKEKQRNRKERGGLGKEGNSRAFL
jgi:hypothetical protein